MTKEIPCRPDVVCGPLEHLDMGCPEGAPDIKKVLIWCEKCQRPHWIPWTDLLHQPQRAMTAVEFSDLRAKHYQKETEKLCTELTEVRIERADAMIDRDRLRTALQNIAAVEPIGETPMQTLTRVRKIAEEALHQSQADYHMAATLVLGNLEMQDTERQAKGWDETAKRKESS